MGSGVNRCVKPLLEEAKKQTPIDNDAMVHFLKVLVKTKSLPGETAQQILSAWDGLDELQTDAQGYLGMINSILR